MLGVLKGDFGGFGHPIFQWRPQYTQFKTTTMYLLIETRHNILIQYHGNNIEVKNVNNVLEIGILTLSYLEIYLTSSSFG